ncbi:hypothetical protein TWF788_009406 [Orbilia oligospora]|uniref:Amino acid permease/ SLC12A domain-containing protein n=1 Tax=Orbilia oligospora TaxID=2813651 RepID=A0A6G1LY01_ORBOL|nr:hypothetical protein TWF788_009406 [Orbilia oligospora]KAF3207135.1 hypothetical protein TWF679_008485 [Orbilia oligospora]KAF3219690.1 hypothetical protein TWF191_007667 [Orbilia oligospora]KAF3238474.1 hypothetical protein TWF192_010311 [Orbilia oligospora]
MANEKQAAVSSQPTNDISSFTFPSRGDGDESSKVEALSDLQSSHSNVVGTTEAADGSPRWKKCLPSFLGMGGSGSNDGETQVKKVKPFNFRHHQMINLTSGIGMGLFVTSGRQLAIGGPGSLLINNILMTIVLYFVSCAMCEISMRYPVSGSFIRYASRFIHPAHGFALGYIYFFAYMFTFGAESNAIAYTIRVWLPSVQFWVVALIFLAVILAIHASPPHIFAEVEFFIGSFRVISVTGFIIWTIFIMCGFKKGNMHETPKFGQYYNNPGPFNMGIKGLVNAAILAAFSNGGVEIGAVASGDVHKPRFSIPRTLNTYRFRMALFYISSLFCITLLLSSDDPALQSHDVLLSPFVHALRVYGYPGLAHVFNLNILLSVLSVANCCMYVCGQVLSVMAEDGNAPRWFMHKNRQGKPARAIAFSYTCGIVVVMIAAFSNDAFEWFANNTGMVFLIVWLSILSIHLMYRRAIAVQGDPDSKTPYLYSMRFPLPKDAIGSIILWFLLGGQVYVALAPLSGPGSAGTFFNAATPIPAWFILVTVYMIWRRRTARFVKANEVDLQTHLPKEDPKETAYIHQYRKIARWRRALTYIPFVSIPVNENEAVEVVMASQSRQPSFGSLSSLGPVRSRSDEGPHVDSMTALQMKSGKPSPTIEAIDKP